MGLAETLMDIPEGAEDPSAAREKLYDREIGKASQQVNVTQTNVNINLFGKIDVVRDKLNSLGTEDAVKDVIENGS